MRNASLEFPSEKTTQTPSTAQYPAGSGSRRRLTFDFGLVASGASRTRRSRSRTAIPKPKATQRIVRSDTPVASSSAATSGPMTAPAVSIARW
jgi:hypothetical protein